MFKKLNKYSYLIFAVCFFVAAAIIENGLLKKHPERHLINDFQTKLHKKEKELTENINRIATRLADSDDPNFPQYLNENFRLLKEKGFGFLVYEGRDLKYWSDRSISFFNNENRLPDEEGLVRLPNGYYFVEKRESGNYNIYGFHLIKNSFNYENKYLKRAFFKGYDLPDDFELVKEKENSAENFAIQSSDGSYLFSVKPQGNYLCTTEQLYLPGIIYFLGLIILLLYFRREFMESGAPFFIRLFGLAVALFLVYWLHFIFKIPKVFFHFSFFSPSVFALNNWLPSLGDYFLLCLFFLFWIYNFGKHLDIGEIQKDTFMPRKAVVMLLFLFAASLYLLVHFYIRELIFNSTISFSFNRIIEISAQSVIGIFSVGMLLLAIFYFTIKIVEGSRNDFMLKELATIVTVVGIFLAVIHKSGVLQ